jgi:hypothetical protein
VTQFLICWFCDPSGPIPETIEGEATLAVLQLHGYRIVRRGSERTADSRCWSLCCDQVTFPCRNLSAASRLRSPHENKPSEASHFGVSGAVLPRVPRNLWDTSFATMKATAMSPFPQCRWPDDLHDDNGRRSPRERLIKSRPDDDTVTTKGMTIRRASFPNRRIQQRHGRRAVNPNVNSSHMICTD